MDISKPYTTRTKEGIERYEREYDRIFKSGKKKKRVKK